MKRLLFILQGTSGASILPQEALDAVLAGSAFSECVVIFTGWGVTQLRQQTTAHGRKAYNRGFGALRDYGIEEIYYSSDAATDHRLQMDELIVDARPLAAEEINQQIQRADAVLSF